MTPFPVRGRRCAVAIGRLSIATDGDVQLLVWHHKGNYCAAVSPKVGAHVPPPLRGFESQSKALLEFDLTFFRVLCFQGVTFFL